MSLAVTEWVTSLVWIVKIVAAVGRLSQWDYENGVLASTYLSQVFLLKSPSVKSQLHPSINQIF